MRTREAGCGLTVVLEVGEPVVVGLSVLATLRVRNDGSAAAMVSCRLNLTEGDVHLSVDGPDGTRVIKGWQADTALRRATLQPGESIVAAINLLYTDAGPTFPVPGKYVLRAEYAPSPKVEPITSPPVSATARLPQSGPETEAAALLADEALREAIVLAKPDATPEGLRQLAAAAGQSLDADLARLLLSDSGAEAVAAHGADASRDPLRRALEITALSTPYSKTGKRLAADFAARFAQDATRQRPPDERPADAMATAVRIVKGEPLRSP